MKERVSIAELRRVVSYNETTGILTWIVQSAYNVFPGMEAGSTDGQGYKHFQYKGMVYPCHQVAWAFVHGDWPAMDIDHKNNVRDNNWIGNLREATSAQNHANRSLAKNNKSGAKGVCFKRGKWEVSIGYTTADGKYKQRYLGRLEDFDLAKIIYAEAAEQMNGDFAWGG